MARSTGSIHVADNSPTAINDAIQQLLFLIDELRGEHDNTTIHIGPHTHAGGTTGDQTDAQDGGPIAADTIDHDDLLNVTSDQHHAKLHETSHREGGIDELKLDDAGLPDDNTDNDATTGHHGLLPKLSGNSNEFLSGAGTFTGVTAAEATDVSHIEGSTQEQIWEQVIAGNNITVTELAGGNAIKLDVSGGAIHIWTPDAPPASAGADDDEFGDASGGVPGGWTESDFGSFATVQEVTEGVRFNMAAAGGTGWAGIYKALPAGDFTVWTKYWARGRRGDIFVAGFLFWEDATSSSGDIIYCGLYSNSGQMHWTTNRYSDYQTFSGGILAGDVALNAIDPATYTAYYVRCIHSGSDYSFQYSHDGNFWVSITNGTFPFTPLHYGIGCENAVGGFGAPNQQYVFEYFRSEFTARDYRDAAYGNRV